MAVVNPMMSPIVYQAAPTSNGGTASVKDSRWLTLDVCREFTRNKCSRTDDECRFAHPPANVEVQNGRVMCCFDSIKGKCQRREPPCKYLHPPQHLKEQLLQNGRNNLILKHLQMQMVAHAIPGVYPIMYDVSTGKSFSTSYIPLQQGQDPYMVQRYLVPVSAPACYSPYYAASGTTYAASPSTAAQCGQAVSLISAADHSGMQPPQHMILSGGGDQQMTNGTLHANDRNEINGNGCGGNSIHQNGVQCSSPVWHAAPASPSTTGCVMTAVDAAVTGATYTSPVYFQAPSGHSGSGMVPMMKSNGTDMGKCGVPFYHPAAVAYQQMAMAATMQQVQQPAYVPITITGHPPVEPRY